MLTTKRHVYFLIFNAFLIFVNFYIWNPYKSRFATRTNLPGDEYDYYANHVLPDGKPRDGTEQEAILAPEMVRGRKPTGSENTTRIRVHKNVKIINSWRSKEFINNTKSKPDTDMYVTPPNIRPVPVKNFSKLRRNYEVPSIETTNLVNCAKLLAYDLKEIKNAEHTMLNRPKVPIYEETYQDWFKDCASFRRNRGYVEIPLTKEEEDFPLAFSIAMYTDIESTERLLRAIYRPNNIYCIHVDIKSSLLIHRTMRALAACFDNVWIASHLDKIKWGDVSVLLPDINCMRDMVRHYGYHKWKYYINLTGQEFPLRTNYEIVKIAQIFNGSNDIGGSIKRMDKERVDYKWTHRWSKRYQQTIFYNTFIPKDPAPYNLTFYKGELHGLFSRRMVEYLVESEVAQKYLEWCWDSGHPSEHYWNVLNYNTHLAVPGGYQGPADLADEYSENQISRAKDWLGLYGNRTCYGKVVRGICIYGVEDTPWLASRPELFANKFHLTYQYLGFDCMEELHRNRTKLKNNVPFDEQFYKNLPTVKYGRKDGVPS